MIKGITNIFNLCDLLNFLFKILAVLVPLAPLSSCISTKTDWSYLHPPQTDSMYHGIEKILWCDSIEGARFTAITGWFAPDCYYTFLPTNEFTVIETNHEEFGTTKVIFVHCKSDQHDIWIPLPSHNWA